MPLVHSCFDALPLNHSCFDVAKRVIPSSSCRNQTRQTWHGYGFGAGDFHSTRRLPARVCKPVTNPTYHDPQPFHDNGTKPGNMTAMTRDPRRWQSGWATQMSAPEAKRRTGKAHKGRRDGMAHVGFFNT